MAVKHELPDSKSREGALKRLKISEQPENSSKKSTVLLNALEIKSLLSFKQDSGPRVQDDVVKVHNFLSQAQHVTDHGLRDRILRSFTEYMQEMTPSELGTSSPALSEVVKTWSFASQFENISLFTSITALLALMLKTMSTELPLRRYGTAICQTVVMDDQVKLLEKGLAVGKGKGQLIVACLSLITEVVSFDGGICSRAVFRHRATLFNRLDEFLTLNNKSTDMQRVKQFRQIRHQAVALLLANVRVQDSSAKAEILCDPKRSRTLFQFISQDSTSDILSILRTLKSYFFADSSVSRSAKARVLSESSLTRIAALYNLTKESGGNDVYGNEQGRNVADLVHEFLLEVCSSAGYGVVLAQDGWYTTEYVNGKKTDANLSDESIVRQHHVSWHSYDGRVPVKNTKLAYFIQDLQPHKNIKHRELVLSVFKTAPELIADFFLRKKTFSFEPKLTSTWIGYAGFLLEVAKLEPPDILVSRSLPSPTIILENILPSFTSSKTFNRCLANTQTLIKFIAAKIVAMSLEKLRKVFEMIKSLQDSQLTGWHEYIMKGIRDRCPDLSTISSVLKGCGEKDTQLKEVLLQLVSQYHQFLPSLAYGKRFDLSILMADMLLSAHNGKSNLLDIINLDHFSDIALSSSPDIDWFRKPDRIPYSPFTTVFRLCITTMDERLCSLVNVLIKEHFVLQSKTAYSAVDWLMTSLRPFFKSDVMFTFLDNCFLRLSQRPVKYEGDCQKLMLKNQEFVLSNLAVVIQEQWPHFTEANPEMHITKVASWLVTWLEGSRHTGENEKALQLIKVGLKRHPKYKRIQDSLKACFQSDGPDNFVRLGSDRRMFMKIPEPMAKKSSALEETTRLLNVSMKLNPSREDFPQLLSWLHKSVVDAVEEGDIAALIQYLSAGDQSVRKQAAVQIRNVASRVEASTYSEKQQLYLLLMEVVETASQHGLCNALPAFTTAFASRCVTVLHEPTNLMYRKINKFLIRAPIWDPSHLPSYWKDKIFVRPPTNNDDHAYEAEWLLEVFIEGLQTAKDFNSYRRNQIFESLLVRADDMPDAFISRTIQLLWRCSFVDGCSTTLLTRNGLGSWMNARLDDVRIEALKNRIIASCDQERVMNWGLDM